jgi:hypothetical protein
MLLKVDPHEDKRIASTKNLITEDDGCVQYQKSGD